MRALTLALLALFTLAACGPMDGSSNGAPFPPASDGAGAPIERTVGIRVTVYGASTAANAPGPEVPKLVRLTLTGMGVNGRDAIVLDERTGAEATKLEEYVQTPHIHWVTLGPGMVSINASIEHIGPAGEVNVGEQLACWIVDEHEVEIRGTRDMKPVTSGSNGLYGAVVRCGFSY